MARIRLSGAEKLDVQHLSDSGEWVRLLEHVADDIADFESLARIAVRCGAARFAHTQDGRLYDMALGPR